MYFNKKIKKSLKLFKLIKIYFLEKSNIKKVKNDCFFY